MPRPSIKTQHKHTRYVRNRLEPKPRDTSRGCLEAAAEEPGEWCPTCETRIKLKPTGGMRTHGPRGFKRVKYGFNCPGLDLGGTE